MPDEDFPPLLETDVPPTPFVLFARWYDEMVAANLPEPSAMTLATATPDGIPSARVVLMRGFDQRGVVFYTNFLSRKGDELASNPRAALVFYWEPYFRQVRIEGAVVKVSAEESDQYFQARPYGHRLGALASDQSAVAASRAVLEARLAHFAQLYPQEVPRPPHWGGYRVLPHLFEFWQGRANRLHDRIRYQLDGPAWAIDRLSP